MLMRFPARTVRGPFADRAESVRTAVERELEHREFAGADPVVKPLNANCARAYRPKGRRMSDCLALANAMEIAETCSS